LKTLFSNKYLTFEQINKYFIPMIKNQKIKISILFIKKFTLILLNTKKKNQSNKCNL
jgi:hypothetical protein